MLRRAVDVEIALRASGDDLERVAADYLMTLSRYVVTPTCVGFRVWMPAVPVALRRP